MAGLSKNVNLISSGVQYALFIIFTTVMFFFVDKVGRRPLLIYGAIAMGICHFIVGGVLSTGEYVPGGVDGNANIKIRVSGSAGNTVIAFCYLLIIIYALTLAPVCWIYAVCRLLSSTLIGRTNEKIRLRYGLLRLVPLEWALQPLATG